jgi:hypothetical protein
VTWVYSQSTGQLSRNGQIYSEDGYSGDGPGLDSPSQQYTPNVGPIPQGFYDIVGEPETHIKLGSFVLRLVARSPLCKRKGFLIHGDRMTGPPYSASTGCIIFGKNIREEIWNSGDRELSVTA